MLSFVKRIIGRDRYDCWFYGRYYRHLLQRDGGELKKKDGETVYQSRWRRLTPYVDAYTFRYYSRFCGNTADIVPEYILHNYIEPCINPLSLWDEYEDKNRFALYLDPSWLPTTVLYRTKGGPINDATGNALQEPLSVVLKKYCYDALILKPAIGTSCGERIIRINRVGQHYLNPNGQSLNAEWLLHYGIDWILQQCIIPHPFMQKFCSSAVSTIRVAVYRSVVNGRSSVTGAVMRVGREGSIIDNTSAGGCYVGINLSDGSLHHTFYDARGKSYRKWNNVDLSKQDFIVPNWQSVLKLAHNVANAIPDHHLIALDIAMDESGNPIVLEYNIGGFSAYLFYQVGQLPFGSYTDEVINYCLQFH